MTTLASIITTMIIWAGALLLAGAFLLFCATVAWCCGEYLWRKLKAVHSVKRLQQGLYDLAKYDKVYPYPDPHGRPIQDET